MLAVVAGGDNRREMSSNGQDRAIGEPIALVLAAGWRARTPALGLRALLFGAGALASSALVNL
jgi:hypothetical protein